MKILYNNYRAQEKKQIAPKAIKVLSPLVAIDQILQHVLPPGFQKARYYGLHASATYKDIKDQIPANLKRNGNTIRLSFRSYIIYYSSNHIDAMSVKVLTI